MHGLNENQLNPNAPIVVAGAGLSGSLMAVLLANRGEDVVIYERRPDPRLDTRTAGRSINLALSHRGISALRRAGLAEQAMAIALPMYGRILHAPDGSITRQPYGPNREHINSISRAGLNRLLVDAADRHDNVAIHFDTPIVRVDGSQNAIKYRAPETGRERTQQASLIIGADGAFSAVRESLRPQGRFNHQVNFVDHGYKELTIPAAGDGRHQLPNDGLHIWPRHNLMLIALPNLDGSFTATLFAPFEGDRSFASWQEPGEIERLFADEFPDALALMPKLADEFAEHPVGSMVSVDVEPWNYGAGAILVGDAAHAIVPFYGQGMNAAFEDCRILDALLAQSDFASRGDVLDAFSRERVPNAAAIRDLALHNFIEMRSDVANPAFLLMKRAERALERTFPNEFQSLYSMVSFSDIPYAEAVERAQRQSGLLRMAGAGAIAALSGILARAAFRKSRD